MDTGPVSVKTFGNDIAVTEICGLVKGFPVKREWGQGHWSRGAPAVEIAACNFTQTEETR